MNTRETEEIILEKAKIHNKNPDIFIDEIENTVKDFPLSGKGVVFFNISNILGNSLYLNLALVTLKRALDYYMKDKDMNGVLSCYGNMSNVYTKLYEEEKANEFLEKALKIAKEIGDKSGEATCYVNRGTFYGSKGDYKKAIEFLEKALEIAYVIKDKIIEESCYGYLGKAYEGLKDYKRAIEYNDESIKIAREIGDKSEELKGYSNLGEIYYDLWDYEKSIEYTEKALEIAKEIGDKSGESGCYGNLGNSYFGLGEFKKAVNYYIKTIEVNKIVGNKIVESMAFVHLGNAYYSLGDFSKAIEYQEKSLKIAKDIGDKSLQSSSYIGLGIISYTKGYFREAIEYYNKSLKIKKEINDRRGEANCYINLGVVYYGIGDFKKIIEYQEKSLKIAKDIGDKSIQSSSYGNLGLAYYSLYDFPKAIEYYSEAIKIIKKTGNKSLESKCYGNLGIIYSKLEDYNKAIEYYEKSLKIMCNIGDKSGEANCYGNLGIFYRSLNNFKKAIEYSEKALKIAREINDFESERISTFNLAIIYGDHLNKPEEAYDFCKRTIELSERIAANLIEEEHKIKFNSRVFTSYKYMVLLCLKLKKVNEAFEFLEQGKSRAFLELLAFGDIKPTVEMSSKLSELIGKEESYITRLQGIQTSYLKRAQEDIDCREIDRIYKELDYIYNEIEKIDPDYVFIRRGKPLSLVGLLDTLSLQRKKTVLIEYFIADEKIVIFIINSKNKNIYTETVPISIDMLFSYVESYWKSVVKYLEYNDADNNWLDLGQYLISPIKKYISKNDLIYIVPYGILHYLPLHALEINGEPLIKNNPVIYLPSASLIKYCRKKGSRNLKSCASFGVDPYGTLKYIVEEGAKAVAELFNTEPYLGEDCIKDNVIKNINKDVIHFLCHGKFDYLNPLSSGILLYNGEILSAREIFNIKLDTELVTLAACETGINNVSPGDELVGLTRAFLYAGTPSVIVSLWSVNTYSTKELIIEFYKNLKKGEDKATSLQKAQIKIMSIGKYSHPYYWAPFILVGNWE